MELVKRTLAILRTIAEGEKFLTLSEISLRTKIPVSSISRIISTLTEEQFVVRGSDRRYGIGPEAIGLCRGGRFLDDASRDILSNLCEEYEETVFLSRFVGNQVRCLALWHGTRPVTLAVRTGDMLPIHASAAARAILAEYPLSRAREVIARSERIKFTPKTLTSEKDILRHLKTVHERGYDICYNELNAGVLVVSAPIIGPHNTVTTSVSMAGAVMGDAEAKAGAEHWLPPVQEAAKRISGLWTHE